MKKKIIIALIVIVSMVALYFIAKESLIYFGYGINRLKFGKTQSKEAIIKYAHDNKIKDDEIYLLKSSCFKSHGQGDFPKSKLFDAYGHELKYHDCFRLLGGFYDTIQHNKAFFKLDTTYHLAQELRNFTQLNGQAVDSTLGPYQYYFIYYYGIWGDVMNQRKLFPQRDKMLQDGHFKVYLVNIDLNADWHMPEPK